MVINEAPLGVISATYQITVQQYTTTALFDIGTSMSVTSQKSFHPLLLKSKTCTVTSASSTNFGLVGQCYLKFKLGIKYFMDKVIVLLHLQRDLILRLNLTTKLDVIGTLTDIST